MKSPSVQKEECRQGVDRVEGVEGRGGVGVKGVEGVEGVEGVKSGWGCLQDIHGRQEGSSVPFNGTQ